MKYKFLMRFLLFSLLCFFNINLSLAQSTFDYTYDASGNRVLRKVITLQSATIPNDSLADNQSNEPLKDQIGLQEIRIYPNPTKGVIRIDFPALDNQTAIIRVHDTQGRELIKKEAMGSVQVDLSRYSSGIYIMNILIGGKRKEWKIIKE